MATEAKQPYDTAALRRQYPVAQVVADSGVELRASGRALIGRCPFHQDGGRPNLYVYPDTQSWFCYRCQSGGDVIAFVQRRDGVGFLDACVRLAGSARRAAQPLGPRPSARRERRWDRLTLEEQIVLNTACALYQHALWRDLRALAYLRERALPDWVIRRCGLGYADGHSLEAYLRRRSGVRTAQELGLLRRPEQGDGGRHLPEFFAGRVLVPELRAGQCLWLIGRALGASPDRPKYLALSGERPILGLERVIGRRAVFLVEGVFDYLTAVAWRLPAFSTCGTHLPADRLGFLARAAVIYGVLDGDEAGRAAGERFGQLLGARFRPLRLPAGCDLNDLARRPDGRRQFFHLLAETRDATPKGDTDER